MLLHYYVKIIRTIITFLHNSFSMGKYTYPLIFGSFVTLISATYIFRYVYVLTHKTLNAKPNNYLN